MRVCCFYTELRHETKRRLDLYAPGWEPVRTAPFSEDVFSYWHAFEDRWGKGEDLVTVEQDIGIHESVISQFADCPMPWCTFSYPMRHFVTAFNSGYRLVKEPGEEPGVFRIHEAHDDAYVPYLDRGLGCARFRAEVQELVDLTVFHEDVHKPWHGYPDSVLANALAEAGAGYHVHVPPVEHYHGDGTYSIIRE